MKYIKKISREELEKSYWDFCRVSDKADVKELMGLHTNDTDICFSDVNDNVFILFQTDRSNFVYFAIDKNRPQNIRAMYETIYELAKDGFYSIRIEGKDGQYEKTLESFGHFKEIQCLDAGHKAFMWDIGNPEVMEKLLARVER